MDITGSAGIEAAIPTGIEYHNKARQPDSKWNKRLSNGAKKICSIRI